MTSETPPPILKGLGIIRVSSKEQLKGHTIETQRRIIKDVCNQHDITLLGIKQFLAVTGRKEESIDSYMFQIKNLVRELGANCIIVKDTSRLGRLLPEIYSNTKILVDEYVKAVYTPTLIIRSEDFKNFNKRSLLYMRFMFDEAEGYAIYERMIEGRKTKKLKESDG